MKKFWSGLCATAMASTFAIAGAIPVNAAPAVYVPQTVQTASDIQQVRHRNNRPHRAKRLRRQSNRIIRREDNNPAFYRDYRGSRYYRPGYRRHDNGFWFPAAAFIAGALVTGALTNNNNTVVVRRSGNAHVSWCYDRYRSYRAYDNTFQPYHGPRRICYSPFD